MNRHCLLARMILALLLFGLVVGCAQQKGETAKPRVAIVTNGVASFWTIAQAGAAEGAQEFDAEVTVHMPAEGISAQKRIVQDLLTLGVDGIAISSIDPDNQADLINSAAQEVHLITIDSDAPETNRLSFVGMDNYDAGRLCGRLVKEAIPEGGKIMIFVGRLEQDNARRRRQGLIDEILDRDFRAGHYDPPGSELRNGRFQIVGTLTDQFDRSKAKANAEDALSLFPDLAAMVGLFAYNPPLCLEALKQAGKAGDVAVIAFDEADETLQGIKDGYIHGTVVQDPYNYALESVRVLTSIIRGDHSVIPENGLINIPARQIRAGNLGVFWADLKSKMSRQR
jgi:ribose transport system substrate-binding protein